MRVTPFLLAAVVMSSTAAAADYTHTFGVGALAIFRVGISAQVAGTTDPSLAAKTDRTYLDGYNRVDSSGNLGEGAPGLPSRTSNFGFTSDQQVNLQQGTLSLHTISPGAAQYVDATKRGRTSAELYYRIIRGRDDGMSFGLEARAGYIDVDYSGTGAIASTVRVLTDAYQLGGVVPQPAPYSGSFNVQPGTQRIGDIPTRTITTTAATTQGTRDFSARGWLLRGGVVWQPWHGRRVELQLHAGPAAICVKGKLRAAEQWVATGQPAYSVSAQGERTKWLTGGYAGATAQFHLNDQWSVYGGVDALKLGRVTIPGGAIAAKFDFSHAVLATAGVAFRF